MKILFYCAIFFLILQLIMNSEGYISASKPAKASSFVYLAKKIPSTSGKVQVKLLVDVKGHGKKGDVIMVSPSLFSNVLQPKKQAQKISDTEVKKEIEIKVQEEADFLTECQKLSEAIENLRESSSLSIKRKCGSSGQLFGTITRKSIAESLKEHLPSSIYDKKSFSIARVAKMSEADKEVVEEIRKIGKYAVQVNLHPSVTATFHLEVDKE
jgi:large subunit ribosomal protein L9